VYQYKYPRPAITVDVVALTLIDEKLSVLLIKRDSDPYKGKLSLPGGFVHEGETLEKTAARVLTEKTPLRYNVMQQFRMYSEVERDPRERVISAAFLAIVPADISGQYESDFLATNSLSALAFDHSNILEDATSFVRRGIQRSELSFAFLPEQFTLSSLQSVCEIVGDREFDKRNFRKLQLALGSIRDTGLKTSGSKHRPAALFERVKSFDPVERS